MKNKKLLWIIIGVVVIGGFGVISLMQKSNGAVAATTTPVQLQDLVEKVSASGRIQPKTKVDITSEINGEIIALPVKEGQFVKPGDLLVVLDTVQIKADVEQAKFSLDETKARLNGAGASLDQAQEEFDRQQRLFDKNLTSETAYRDAKYALANAKANFEGYDAATRRLQAAYDKELDYLSKAKIRAPMAGVISYLDCEVGEIAAAQTSFTQGKTLMTIADLSVFEVEVEVDETEINKVELGQTAEIDVDAFPDTSFAGQVTEIGNTAITTGLGTQDQSTNFSVKVMFVDPGVELRPGMSADVDITTAMRDDVIAVPFSAVVMRSYDLDSLERARNAAPESGAVVNEGHAAENDNGEMKTNTGGDPDEERKELKGVFVVREGVARFVQVETGVAGKKDIEITSGVEATDTVISGPYRVLRTIKDGDKVEAENKDSKRIEGNVTDTH